MHIHVKLSIFENAASESIVHSERIRGEVYQHWRQDMKESSEKLREVPRGTEQLREAQRSSEIVLQSVIQHRSILLSNFYVIIAFCCQIRIGPFWKSSKLVGCPFVTFALKHLD